MMSKQQTTFGYPVPTFLYFIGIPDHRNKETKNKTLLEPAIICRCSLLRYTVKHVPVHMLQALVTMQLHPFYLVGPDFLEYKWENKKHHEYMKILPKE